MRRHAVGAAAIVGHDDADTVVIEAGHIVELTRASRLEDVPLVRHDGAEISPLFTDSHIHPLGYAALVSGTSLMGAATVAEVADRMAEAAARTGAGQAVIAQRLDDTPLGRLPTRLDLDAVIPDRPAIAYRYCGHVAVANSAALDRAGIGADSPDPAGGSLDRDDQGRPTGVLRETAVDIVSDALEPLAPPLGDDQALAAFHGLAALGIGHVGAIVAATQGLWCGVGDEIATLCRLAPDLPVDVDVLVIADEPARLEEARGRLEAAGPRLRFWGWKGFADGSLGGHTAAMHRPFLDQETTGTLRLDPERHEQMARAAVDLGGVAAIHAIGDRAVDATLDLFEGLLSSGVDPGRLRVEHASVVTDRAISRLAGTGIIASIQPSFLTSEATWVPGRLGPARPAYRFRTMAAAGVRLLGGSDCPVERPDPLVGVAAAVLRPGWDDDEHLTVAQALDLFTAAPRTHFGRPAALAPGAPADFVIVEGAVGAAEAVVASVYRDGRRIEPTPLAWPG